MRGLGDCSQGAQRAYTGAIAPAFGENVITHGCSCVSGASAHGDGSGLMILLGAVAGAVIALWKGDAK